MNRNAAIQTDGPRLMKEFNLFFCDYKRVTVRFIFKHNLTKRRLQTPVINLKAI